MRQSKPTAIAYCNGAIVFLTGLTDSARSLLKRELSCVDLAALYEAKSRQDYSFDARICLFAEDKLPSGLLSKAAALLNSAGWGLKIINKIPELKPIDYDLPQHLRDYQRAAIARGLQQPRGTWQIPTGGGKCFGVDTPILMADGTIKLIQNVNPNDLLMGDDSTPRQVLNICQGIERLYQIVPDRGDPWICNESHILSLVCTSDGVTVYGREINIGDVVDLPLTDYLQLTHISKQGLKQYRRPVYRFAQAESKETSLSSEEVNNWITKISKQPNQYSLCIPLKYKTASFESRVKLLQGLLGGNDLDKCEFAYVTKSKRFANDVCFLARSLGLAAYIREDRNQKHKSLDVCKEYQVDVSGDSLDSLLEDSFKLRALSNSVLNVSFKVELLEEGTYYGFTIDGNRRFLLADFTVVHNTLAASCYIKYFPAVPILITVPKIKLARQFQAAVAAELEEPIGLIGDGELNWQRVTVGVIDSLATLAAKSDPRLAQIRVVVHDEAHYAGSPSYLNLALALTQQTYVLGLSATLKRSDGKDLIVEAVCGPLSYVVEEKKVAATGATNLPTYIRLDVPDRYKKEKRSPPTLPAYTNHAYVLRLYKYSITNHLERTRLTVDCIERLLAYPSRQGNILVMFQYIEHGELIQTECLRRGLDVPIVHSRTNRKDSLRLCEEFKQNQLPVLLGSNVFKEGIDLPNLEFIVQTGGSSGEGTMFQQIGRSVRTNADYCKSRSVVIDLGDTDFYFGRRSDKRWHAAQARYGTNSTHHASSLDQAIKILETLESDDPSNK